MRGLNRGMAREMMVKYIDEGELLDGG